MVLRRLVGYEYPNLIELTLREGAREEQEPWSEGLTGVQVNEILEEARHRFLIEGKSQGGDGSWVVWTHVRLTVHGLRALGEWPPAGKEAMPGPWEDGVWGRIDNPVLRDLHEQPPEHRFIFKPVSAEQHERFSDLSDWDYWLAVLRLLEAGFVDGAMVDGGMKDVRVTTDGGAVLNPPQKSPLDEAEADLRLGNRLQAAMTAGLLLENQLKALAQKHAIDLATNNGTPKRARVLADDLKSAGAYNEVDRAHVQVWLAIRNEAAHKLEHEFDDHQVALMIDGVRQFVERHPA